MCGITGFWDISTCFDREKIQSIVKQMNSKIYHRGPDSDGVWSDEKSGIGLGHQRLAIVDLSPLGHQPMLSQNQRYVLVFNGEIYNFQELKTELMQLGVCFQSTSDTEVMLAAFTQWGIEPSVKKFTGMFAFALWDRDQQILSLGRDRIGEKPLYYGLSGNTFVFASELKSLKTHPHWQGAINREALGLFFKYSYIPTPHTIYQGIYKLLPGTILTLNQQSFQQIPQPQAYWSLDSVAKNGLNNPFLGNESDAVVHLEGLLKNIISQQMIADVPLGAFLSGGVDSSATVAIMQSISNQPIKTFTIGFAQESYNEAPYAKAIAQHLGTDHTELYVTPAEANAVIPTLPAIYDEPFADSSQIPTILVSKLARSQVTVSLSGDAGDEVFGGYNRYFLGEKFQRNISPVPLFLRKIASSSIASLSPQQWDQLVTTFGIKYPTPGDRLYKLASILGCPDEWSFYDRLVSCWLNTDNLVLNTTVSSHPLAKYTDNYMSGNFVSEMMLNDLATYLPDDILVKVDRASMSVSLESRIPFLNHHLIEFAASLPLSMKLRDNQTKWLLRQVLYKYVPKEMIERPKQGFGIPIDTLLRTSLRDWAESLLDSKKIRSAGLLNDAVIQQKWAEHLSGKRNWQHHLWSVLMFQSWLEENG